MGVAVEVRFSSHGPLVPLEFQGVIGLAPDTGGACILAALMTANTVVDFQIITAAHGCHAGVLRFIASDSHVVPKTRICASVLHSARDQRTHWKVAVHAVSMTVVAETWNSTDVLGPRITVVPPADGRMSALIDTGMLLSQMIKFTNNTV